MQSAIPTRSITIWHMLINRYINAHILNGKSLSIERAHEDLIKLYQELHAILGHYANDHTVLHKLHILILEYENEGMGGFSALDLSD
jgi:hypothetical protein